VVARDVVATGCFANDSWDSTAARSRQDGAAAARDFIIVRMSLWKMKQGLPAILDRGPLTPHIFSLHLL